MPPNRRSLRQPALEFAFVAACTLALLLCAAALVMKNGITHRALIALGLAVLFGSAVIALRAATMAAALCGMLIAFITWISTGLPGFASLFVLFVTTWAATRIGREHKRRLGTAENRRGRRASQILANLAAFGVLAGLSALCAGHQLARLGFAQLRLAQLMTAGAAAALAEAAGDTVSSEIGQVYGGTPYLITSFRPVVPGTDGGITVPGTLAGAAAAALVLATWAFALRSFPRWLAPAAIAAWAGIMFDSLLGATLERRRYLNNDSVNFSSTWFAAAVAMGLMWACP